MPLLLIIIYLIVGGAGHVAGSGQLAPSVIGCRGGSLDIVAHEDDDILFMNPDIQNDITAKKCVTTVYLTAGDYGLGWQKTKSREEGSKAAYAEMVGQPDNWQSRTLNINSKRLLTYSLDGNRKINLIFMRLPNTGGSAIGYSFYDYQSLAALYNGKIKSMTAVDGSASYTLNQLVRTLRSLIILIHPDVIRLQDYKAQIGEDHADHIMGAKITLMADSTLKYQHTDIIYYDYQITGLPVNLDKNTIKSKMETWWAYAPFDGSACQTVAACRVNGYYPRLFREYIVGVISRP